MKNLFCFLLLVFLSQSNFAQLEFLENGKGIKSIQTTFTSGKKDAPKTKSEGTKYFSSDGKLEKYEDKYERVHTYIYEGNDVIELFDSKWDECITAFEYNVTYTENSVTIKTKMHEGKYKPENACGRMEAERDFMGADASELFKDVKRSRKFEGDYFHVLIIEYPNSEDKNEYVKYYYSSTRSKGNFKLTDIITSTKDINDTYLRFSYGVESYGKRRIVVSNQRSYDKYDYVLKEFDERELYQKNSEGKAKHNYKIDEKGNWIKQTWIKDYPENVLERNRIVVYY